MVGTRRNYSRFIRYSNLHVAVWLLVAIMLVITNMYPPSVGTNVSATSPASMITSTQPAAGSPVLVSSPSSIPPTPSCSRMAFGTPSQVALSTTDSPFTVFSDTPTTYQIYGNTAQDLRAQIRRCAPKSDGSANAEFTAETSYNLSWQYDMTIGGGSCYVSNAKVGVHTAMALPNWQPSAQAAPGLASKWQRFSANLLAHEQGHVTIDSAYAHKLAIDLEVLTAPDCDTLRGLVDAVVGADVAALNSANDAYDAQTNHGATQGAIVP